MYLEKGTIYNIFGLIIMELTEFVAITCVYFYMGILIFNNPHYYEYFMTNKYRMHDTQMYYKLQHVYHQSSDVLQNSRMIYKNELTLKDILNRRNHSRRLYNEHDLFNMITDNLNETNLNLLSQLKVNNELQITNNHHINELHKNNRFLHKCNGSDAETAIFNQTSAEMILECKIPLLYQLDNSWCLFGVHKYKRMVFMGDSTMLTQYNSVLNLMQQTNFVPTSRKMASRCPGDYLFGKGGIHIEQQNYKGYGPLVNGVQNPGCTDCSSCPARQIGYTYYDHKFVFEYLPFEFMKDTMLHSKEFNTTQDAYLAYLKQVVPEVDLVYMSVLIHDAVLLSGGEIDMDQYAQHVNETISLYHSTFGDRLVIGIGAYGVNANVIKYFTLIQQIMLQICEERNIKIFRMDTLTQYVAKQYRNRAFKKIFIHDGQHYTTKIYDKFAQLFTTVLC